MLCQRFVPAPVCRRVTTQKLLSTDFDGGTLACARTSRGRSRQGRWRWIKGGSSQEDSSPGEQPQQLSEDQLASTLQPCHTGSSRSAPGPWGLTQDGPEWFHLMVHLSSAGFTWISPDLTVSKPLFCCADSWQFSYPLCADGDWTGPASSMQELWEVEGVKTWWEASLELKVLKAPRYL